MQMLKQRQLEPQHTFILTEFTVICENKLVYMSWKDVLHCGTSFIVLYVDSVEQTTEKPEQKVNSLLN